MDMANRIVRARREAEFYRQGDFADAVGVSQKTVSGWEHGKPLRQDNLEKVARVTKKPLPWFFEEDPPEEEPPNEEQRFPLGDTPAFHDFEDPAYRLANGITAQELEFVRETRFTRPLSPGRDAVLEFLLWARRQGLV